MRKRVLYPAIGILTISLALTWGSSGYPSLQGWAGFLTATLVGAGILGAGWWAIRRDPEFAPPDDALDKGKGASALPTWLGWLLIGAALLRLGTGVLWSLALPQWGYGSEVEEAGYVMADAHKRDGAAWQLAQSDASLATAFTEYRSADQYGGLLFGSAVFYRYFGGDTHHPLMIAVFSASVSAMVVLFTWGFTRRIWGAGTAGAAAWIAALFPDAVLLGGVQMREAFLITLVMAGFYGLVRLVQDRSLTGAGWLIFSIAASLPLSPLVAILLTFFAAVFALFITNTKWLKDWRVWAAVFAILVLVLILTGLWGEQILPGGASNPVVLLQRWLKQASRWQAYNSERASGWMQKIFRSTPEEAHTWILVGYGIMRPFLPAALFDAAVPIWQGIAIWRALGWTLLLPFLAAAPFLSLSKTSGWRSPEVGLSLIVWAAILLSSFRGGGDHWDNPRYRTTWIGLQAALAGWVLITLIREKSPWLRRIPIGMGVILIWWVPWYLRRITPLPWPIQDVFVTLGLGLISALVYLGADLWLTKRKRDRPVDQAR